MVTVTSDEVEPWYLSQILAEDDSNPAAYQPAPKEWIGGFITQLSGANEGLAAAERIFGNRVVGEPVQHPENRGGYITAATDGNTDRPICWRTQAQ
jgi:hypothetical protein